MQRCRYFESFPRTTRDFERLGYDFFYQEHLKSGHFSLCEPLAALHDGILPELPPLRAEVPFSSISCPLIKVKPGDKLLSSRHIRLVKLLPPDHLDDMQKGPSISGPGHLRFEVYQVSLDDVSSAGQPIFAALSYACGNPTLTRKAWCDQDCIPTTRNVFDALLHVRHDDRSRLLWADGLCINQEDTEERSHQVAMLNQIYRQAHVITWLGAGNQTDPTVLFDYLSLTAQVWTSVVRSLRSVDTLEAITHLELERYKISLAANAEYEKRCGRQPPSSDLNQILNVAYFTRVWVTQEIILGKSVTCQLGHQLFSVATLVASMRLWGRPYIAKGRALDDIAFYYLMPSLEETWLTSQNTTRSALSLVQDFRENRRSDPRDHIYGLSALFKDPTAHKIDYSLSVSEVFCNFTVHYLETYKNLSIFRNLCTATQPIYMTPPADGSAPDLIADVNVVLPSWCPSWVGKLHCRSRILYEGPDDCWDASGGRSLLVERSSPLAITLRGWKISNVTWCSTEIVGLAQSSRNMITEAVEFLLSCPRSSQNLGCDQNLDLTLLISSPLKNLSYKIVYKWKQHKLVALAGFPLRDSVLELLGPLYLAGMFPDPCSSAKLEIDIRIPRENYEAIIGRGRNGNL